jgi:hypothetical protein
LLLAGFGGESLAEILAALLIVLSIAAGRLRRRVGIVVLLLALVHVSCGGDGRRSGSVDVQVVEVSAVERSTAFPVTGLPVGLGSVATR